MKGLWSITTYKKLPALRNIITDLQSPAADWLQLLDIQVCDDNDGEAEEVAKEFGVIYTTGPNVGIARNKNRGIHYFLENKEKYDFLILSDDDLHIAPGLLEEFFLAVGRDNEFAIGTFLGKRVEAQFDSSYIDPASGEGWFNEFPIQAQTDNLIWSAGSQGICSFYTREIVEKIGYFKKFKYFYGTEHAEYASRANRIQGKCPDLFPHLRYSSLFITCQNIPNDYQVNPEKINQNYQQYMEYLTETYKGVKLRETNHNLNLAKERTVKYANYF